MFDTDSFLQGTVTGKGSTSLINIPEGEYFATIDKIDARTVTTKNGDRVVLDLVWLIADEAVKEVTKRARNAPRQTCWLDLTDSDSSLDMSEGQNIDLNRVREAVGQNHDGPWAPNDLLGQGAYISVVHRIDKDRIFDDVKGVRSVAS